MGLDGGSPYTAAIWEAVGASGSWLRVKNPPFGLCWGSGAAGEYSLFGGEGAAVSRFGIIRDGDDLGKTPRGVIADITGLEWSAQGLV